MFEETFFVLRKVSFFLVLLALSCGMNNVVQEKLFFDDF